MKEQIKIALWNKVKSTYPIGTSKHKNAILEDDFENLIDELFSLISNDMPKILNDFTKIELLSLLEDLSDYIPCEVYTKKVIQIKERGLS